MGAFPSGAAGKPAFAIRSLAVSRPTPLPEDKSPLPSPSSSRHLASTSSTIKRQTAAPSAGIQSRASTSTSTEQIHPFFQRPTSMPAASASTSGQPHSSKSSTALTTPRVLSRAPSGTTRKAPSKSTSVLSSTAPSISPYRVPVISTPGLPEAPSLSLSSPSGSSESHSSLPPQETASPSECIANSSVSTSPSGSRTQKLFRELADIDASALKFGAKDFVIMMDLRRQHQWDSRRLSPSAWTQAIELFNKKRIEHRPSAVSVLPRVFQEEFIRAEKNVERRLMHNDPICEFNNFPAHHLPGTWPSWLSLFVSPDQVHTAKSSSTDTFWKEHCHAVPGFGPSPIQAQSSSSASAPSSNPQAQAGPELGTSKKAKKVCTFASLTSSTVID